jgi:hypothetical protein
MPEPLDERQNLVEEKKNRDGFNRNKLPDSKQPLTPPGNKWKRKNLTLFLAMVVVAITLVQLLDHQNPVEEKKYSEFQDMIADSSLAIVGIEMQRIGEGYLLVGERQLTPEEQADRRDTQSARAARTVKFKVLLPDIDADIQPMLARLDKRGVKIEFIKETRWLSYLRTLFPLLLLIRFHHCTLE